MHSTTTIDHGTHRSRPRTKCPRGDAETRTRLSGNLLHLGYQQLHDTQPDGYGCGTEDQRFAQKLRQQLRPASPHGLPDTHFAPTSQTAGVGQVDEVDRPHQPQAEAEDDGRLQRVQRCIRPQLTLKM